MYGIEFAAAAVRELAELRAYDRTMIVQSVYEQLSHEPATPTRNRKALAGVTPPFDAVPPLWELRVAEYRVFYDVDEDQKKVFVRAVRHKPPHKTTQEVLK